MVVLVTDDKAESAADNPVIAKMTEDLVSGRRTPQEVIADQVVAEEFNKAAARFGQWYESLSEKDKRRAAEAGAPAAGEQPPPEPGARSTLLRRRRPSTEADGG